jgi:hypothetical protein
VRVMSKSLSDTPGRRSGFFGGVAWIKHEGVAQHRAFFGRQWSFRNEGTTVVDGLRRVLCGGCHGNDQQQTSRPQRTVSICPHVKNLPRMVSGGFWAKPVQQPLRLCHGTLAKLWKGLEGFSHKHRAAIASLVCSTSASKRPRSRSRSAPFLHSAVTARAFTSSRK